MHKVFAFVSFVLVGLVSDDRGGDVNGNIDSQSALKVFKYSTEYTLVVDINDHVIIKVLLF